MLRTKHLLGDIRFSRSQSAPAQSEYIRGVRLCSEKAGLCVQISAWALIPFISLLRFCLPFSFFSAEGMYVCESTNSTSIAFYDAYGMLFGTLARAKRHTEPDKLGKSHF